MSEIDWNTQGPAMRETLRETASWLAFVVQGIERRKIPDQTILDTSGSGATVNMEPLNVILQRKLDAANEVLRATKMPA